MRATNNIGELRARMECGLSTARDAKVLFKYIDLLIWRKETCGEKTLLVCRHCGTTKGNDHASACPAGQAG